MIPTLVIIAVVVMLVGSLTWVLPSPRERKQMELRQVAMKLGLRVNITDLDAVIDEGRGAGIHCIAYGLSRQSPTSAGSWQVARERHTGEHGIANTGLPRGWYWSSGDLPSATLREHLHTLLLSMSDDVLAIESTPHSCIIYWREHGTVQQVEQFATILKTLDELEQSFIQ